MRSPYVFLIAFTASLALAGAAQAGCWATAGVDPLPENVGAGETWAVDVTILQHGRTPMTDAQPVVVITNGGTGTTREFPAARTSRPGLYQAEVVFPSEGTWAIAVDDGFPVAECAQTHTFGSFTIEAPGAGPTEPPTPEPAPAVPLPTVAAEIAPAETAGAFPWWALGLGLGLAAAAAAGVFLARGLRRSTRPA
jgi:hypothetical protein